MTQPSDNVSGQGNRAAPDGHLRYLLTAYVFENLSDAGRAEVESHLADCAACRGELAELRSTVGLLTEVLSEPGEDEEPYSFEAHRLERVLAVSRRRRPMRRRFFVFGSGAVAAGFIMFAIAMPSLMQARKGNRAPMMWDALDEAEDEVAMAPSRSRASARRAAPRGITRGRGEASTESRSYYGYDDAESSQEPVVEFPALGARRSPGKAEADKSRAPVGGKPASRSNLPFTAAEPEPAPEPEPLSAAVEIAEAVHELPATTAGMWDGRPAASDPAADMGGPDLQPTYASTPKPKRPASGQAAREKEFGNLGNKHLDGRLARPGDDDGATAEGEESARLTVGFADGLGAESNESVVVTATGTTHTSAGMTLTDTHLDLSVGGGQPAQPGPAQQKNRYKDLGGELDLRGKREETALEELRRSAELAATPAPSRPQNRVEAIRALERDDLDEKANEALRLYRKELTEKAKDSTRRGDLEQAQKLIVEAADAADARFDRLEELKKVVEDQKRDAGRAGIQLGATIEDAYGDNTVVIDALVGGDLKAGRKIQLRPPGVTVFKGYLGDLEVNQTGVTPTLNPTLHGLNVNIASKEILSAVMAREGGTYALDDWNLSSGGTGIATSDGEGKLGLLVDGNAQDQRGAALNFFAPAAEKKIRAFGYFRSLDRGLSVEGFRTRGLEIPPPAVGDEGLGRDRFRERYRVNPFVDTTRDHLSTFAMDVDTAAYTRARALLRAGQLPDPDTVRVEEFVNFFDQDYAADPQQVFSVFSEGGPSPFGAGLELVKVTVKARELAPAERRHAVLTFAIDTSGSMFLDGRLALVKSALSQLLSALSPDDQVAVVAYGSQAYLALPHTPARERERILGVLSSLRPGGSTNVEAGLDLAYRLADEVREEKALHRVVLCSDGVATDGARGADEILGKVKVYAQRGIDLSVVGFGKSRYNDGFLETLADQGNGNYAYVDSQQEATRLFADNLPSVLEVLARDAKIQVDWNPDTVRNYRLLGYENRDIKDSDFRNDKVDAGEVGPGATVTALYEVRRRPGAHGPLGKVFLRYHATDTGKVEELNFPLAPGVLRTSLEQTSDRFRFLACAAELAELLRESYWARDGAFADVLHVLAGLDPSTRSRPDWQELVELTVRAQHLTITKLAGQ